MTGARRRRRLPFRVPPRLLADIARDPSGCWLWLGPSNADGYGVARRGGRPVLAHRYVWAMSGRRLPDGLTLDHRCRVRLCVRPDHLDIVAPAANSARLP